MRSQKATKNQNGKCYVLTPQRYVRAEEEALEEEEGLDEKRLHLTAKEASAAPGCCTLAVVLPKADWDVFGAIADIAEDSIRLIQKLVILYYLIP
ncbi:hypothetical protein Q5692_10105 [Microcoleus sp. C2C3]|uniref:hypothetical protein n=1 Tax=unclassified Microcoleus TaxID=2642155 RepID=UPI002FCF616C